MATWHVYLIRTRHGALYTGIATDVSRRLKEHEQGGDRGAKYLRSKGPLQLVYQAEIGTRALALKAECAIKKFSKRKKEKLVAAGLSGRSLLELLKARPKISTPGL